MKGKVLKPFMAIILIITLTGANLVFLGNRSILAIYEELERQNTITSVENIAFDAYFKDGEEKKHNKQAIISKGENLILDIEVQNSGVLEDVKIKIENANFTIDKEKIEDKNIKSINEQTNEIELNQIASKNVVITLPILFKKENAKTSNYFDQENKIKLTGSYKKSDTFKRDVEGEIATRLIWTENVNTNLTQEIEKYIDLGEEGILLQQKVSYNVENNALPVEKQNIKINIPEIAQEAPDKIVVLYNGKKLETNKYEVKEQEKIIEINQEQDNNKITWETGAEEYQIIYTYKKQNNNIAKNIKIDTTAKMKLYEKDEETKNDVQEIELTPKGEIISLNKLVTPSIYKGYMYADVKNENTYKEKITLGVSHIEQTENEITLKENMNYKDNQNVEYNVNENIYYKTIQINKNNMLDILGENAQIKIIKEDDKTYLNILDIDTEANENGDIVFNIEDTQKNIKIITNEPVNEGNLDIYISKAISGKTGYEKQILKTFVELEDITNMAKNDKEIKSAGNIELKDTETEAKLEVNNKQWSTLQQNENVQIVATLLSNNEKYDTWKNPYIEIQLPEEIEEIKVKSINPLYADEFKVESSILEGKTIKMQFSGEQKEFHTGVNEGTQIIINADITLNKITPSKESKIKMIYRNENQDENKAENEKEIAINLNSKNGVLVYNQISNYNKTEEKIESISEETVEGLLKTKVEERVLDQEINIVNNYKEPLNNVVIVGRISEEIEKGKNLIDAQLIEQIKVDRENVEIYYSEDRNAKKDSDTWTNNVENAKSYKIVLKDESMNPNEMMKISYNIKMPDIIEASKINYNVEEVSYLYNGEEKTEKSIMKLATTSANEQEVIGKEETVDGVKVTMKPTIGNTELKENEEVYGGQSIRYEVEITNNTGNNLNNVNIQANYTNVNFYDAVSYEAYGPYGPEENVFIEEVENKTQKEFTIDTLANGETKTITYEFAVKELESGEVTGSLTIGADEWEEHTIQAIRNNIKKADIKIAIANKQSETSKLDTFTYVPLRVDIKNLTQTNLDEVIVNIYLDQYGYFKDDTFWDEECEILEYDEESNILKTKISNIKSNETKSYEVDIWLKIDDKEVKESQFNILADTQINNNTYVSNKLTRMVYQTIPTIEINQQSEPNREYVRDGDFITYTTTIRNTGIVDDKFKIEDDLPDTLKNIAAYYTKDGKRTDIEMIYNLVTFEVELKQQEEITLVIEAQVNAYSPLNKTMDNKVTVARAYFLQESNIVNYKIFYEEEQNDEDDSGNAFEPFDPDDLDTPTDPTDPDDPDNPDNPDDPDNPDEPNNPDNPDEPSNPEDEQYNISGIAWIDENRDGKRDTMENAIQGINVILLNANTGKAIKTVQTKEDGNYIFENISKNQYIVAFEYDTNKYMTTEYRKTGVSQSENSDVIAKTITIDGKQAIMAVTDNIVINDENIVNIDAGFYENKEFDLSLQKGIRKIIIQNKKGTTVKQYNDASKAKVEIHSKEIQGSNIIIEYIIKVKNEGKLAGYANDIIDYLSKDLTFNSEINKDWYMTPDGNLHNNSLNDEIIKPGETKELTLTLTKTMTTDNMGLIYNTAEIGETMNNLNQPDKDSTPNNNNKNEDDISSVELIVSIGTGALIGYISLIIISAVILVAGIYEINKKVLGKE